MLRKIFVVALIICAVSSVAAAQTSFRVVNETGKTITQIYISPMEENTWLIQSSDVLTNGESTLIDFDATAWLPRQTLRYFDISVDYDDFTQEIWRGLDLYNYSEIRLQRGDFSTVYKD